MRYHHFFRIVAAGILLGCFMSASAAQNSSLPSESTVNEAMNSFEAARPDVRVRTDPEDGRAIERLDARQEKLTDVLDALALETGIPIVVLDSLIGETSLVVSEVALGDLLRLILEPRGFAYRETDGIIEVMTDQRYQRRFQTAFNDKVATRVVPLQHAGVNDILPAVMEKISPSGRLIFNNADRSLVIIEAPSKLKELVALVASLDSPIKEQTFVLTNIPVRGVTQDVEGLLTDGVGSFRVSEGDNTITVTDKAEILEKVRQQILFLDKPPVKFTIRTKIIQIVLNEEYLSGVDWEAIVSNYKSMASNGFYPDESSAALSIGTVNEEDYEILLDALDTVGPINNVSDFESTVLNREAFEIMVRSMDLVWAGDNVASGDDLDRRDIRFDIIPRLTGENEFEFTINAPGKEHEGHSPEDNVAIDVANRSTLVIGGLFKDVPVSSIQQIPFLGNIPLLGAAFRSESQRMQKTEVILFLTPINEGKKAARI